ncbi:MAG: amphi-Trp domain-containing protein [Thermodesulfobacteriota bacterium]
MTEKNKIQNKAAMTLNEAISYLEELSKGFKQGKIVVQQGEEFITLLPPENVQVEVEAKQKHSKEKFSLELSWVPMGTADSEEQIKITQTEPEPKEKPDKSCDTAAQPETAEKQEAAAKEESSQNKGAATAKTKQQSKSTATASKSTEAAPKTQSKYGKTAGGTKKSGETASGT